MDGSHRQIFSLRLCTESRSPFGYYAGSSEAWRRVVMSYSVERSNLLMAFHSDGLAVTLRSAAARRSSVRA